jgi:hypothetical protein
LFIDIFVSIVTMLSSSCQHLKRGHTSLIERSKTLYINYIKITIVEMIKMLWQR